MCQAENPPVIYGSSFASPVYTNASLMVPSNCSETYKSHEIWGQFSKILSPEDVIDLEVSCNVGGKVSFNGNDITNSSMSTTMEKGYDISLSLSCDEGYEVKSVLLNGVEVVSLIEDNTLIVSSISQNTSVVVTFAEIEIIPDNTDISTFTDVIYFDSTKAKAGKGSTLTMNLKNQMEVAAMKFDLYLPKGVELEKNARGKYVINFNEEANRSDATMHSVSSALQEDGAIRVACYSASADIFVGNEGAIFDFPVTLSADMEPGDYKIILKNIELTTPQGVSKHIEQVVSTLTIPAYTRGDANGDDEIGMADVMYVVNSILGSPAENFDSNGADANEDGEIGMADVMYIIQYILTNQFPENASNAKDVYFDPEEWENFINFEE